MEDININYITLLFNRNYSTEHSEVSIKDVLLKSLNREYYLFFDNSDIFKGTQQMYFETKFNDVIENILKSSLLEYDLTEEDIEFNTTVKREVKNLLSKMNEISYVDEGPLYKMNLTQKKKPIKRVDLKQIIKDVKITKKPNLTQQNNENIMDFFSALSKNIRFNKNFAQIEENLTISSARKTSRVIILEQMDKSEIVKIKNRRKIKPSIFFQLNENMENEKQIQATKRILRERTVKKDFENGIANVNMEDIDEALQKYKYYKDDDKLFKLNLNQTYILNNKIGFLNDIKKKLLGYLEKEKKN